MSAGRETVRDGVELAWEAAGSGPRLVWGHGLTSSRAHEDTDGFVDWQRVRDRVDVLRYDARGHGDSSLRGGPEAYGWDELAHDQLALADALGWDRFVAGGASMGAATALHAAVIAPKRIRALVLVIPPTAWETRADQVELYAAGAELVATEGVEAMARAGAAAPIPDPFAADETAYRERRAARTRAADPERLATVLRGAGRADLPARDRVAAITAPTLVLAWTGDPGHPVSTAEELGRLIDGAVVEYASTADELGAWGDRIGDFVVEHG